MIRTILFDMGNVLVQFSHERMCEQMADACGMSTFEMRQRLFPSGLLIDFECGRLSPDEFLRKLVGHEADNVDPEAVRVACCDIFSPMPGISDVLRAIRRRGLRLVLLSNTSIWHYEWVRSQFDVLAPFDAAVTSFEAGAIKPESVIYETALERIDCPAENCFYTDDIVENIEIGRTFGLNAEVFTSTADLVQQLADRGIALES